MDTTQQTLPNQVEEKAQVNTQNKGNKEIRDVWEEIKEIRESLSNLKQNLIEENSEGKKEIKVLKEFFHMNGRKDDLLARGIFLLFCIVFTGISVYSISLGISTYTSEPIMSTIALRQNKTFQWPTITVYPSSKFCHNQTAIKELLKKHKFERKYREIPFDISSSSFNWSANNVSDMYVQTTFRPPLTNFTSRCRYLSSARKNWDCYSETLGTWETYTTQYGVKESFTPIPASTNRDKIVIKLNLPPNCSQIFVKLHPSNTKDYDNPMIPSTQEFNIHRGQMLWVTLNSAEEFHRVSTRSFPCVKNISYTQAQCFDEKIIDYKIMRAGCYFPGITGYHPNTGGYPECNNSSSFNNFTYWHSTIDYDSQLKHDDLEKMLNECGESCDTVRYRSSYEYYSGNETRFTLTLHPHAMSILTVNDDIALTLDVLLANIGGTLGLFLGVSCLTCITTVQYAIHMGFA